MALKAIALVGMPGSGKSTVGKQLARRLRIEFVDMDHEIEQREGAPVAAIFAQHGESYFRRLESALLAEFALRGGFVLSTGGGTVLDPANRECLRGSFNAVYLRSSPEELRRRLRHDTSRPLLQVSDPEARLRELFIKRDPLYLETARFVIETGRPSVPSLVNMVLMQLELGGLLDSSIASSPVDGPLSC